MMKIRRSNERGHVEHGWLDSYHTFSFANYYDPDWMGFGPLRVINEDRIQGKQGFGEHFHNDMEIITYVIDGALEHKDSMGNGSIIRPNQAQYMSAGTGVMHSEFNPEESAVHLLQIWIEPNIYHATPQYEEKELSDAKHDELQLIASPTGRDESIAIRQNASVSRGMFEAGGALTYPILSGRRVWIQLISGELKINNEVLTAGDACALFEETEAVLTAISNAHFLFFDLP
ncbi:MAG: pirin family protein [Patescibacteria group bacterium]